MKAAVPARLLEPAVPVPDEAQKKRIERHRRALGAGRVAGPVIQPHARRGRARTWSVGELPVGTIWERTAGPSGTRVRMVKVRADGPSGMRWKNYARWWWEQNRGPVPPGMRVLHRDGDTLNDDPSNLFVGSAADAIALWHVNNPEASEAQLRRCHAGAAAHNRLRGEVFRLTAWVKDAWYPVDFGRRVVFNDPKRTQWEVYGAHAVAAEVETVRHANGHGVVSWALGWPGAPALAACALAALALAPLGLPVGRVLEDANAIGARYGRGPASLGGLWQAARRVPWKEWVVRTGRGGQVRRYFISEAGLAARRSTCAVVAVHSARLIAGELGNFEKVKPDGRRYAKRRLDEQALLELAGVVR